MELEKRVERMDRTTLAGWQEELEGQSRQIEARLASMQADFEASVAPLRREQERLRSMSLHIRSVLELLDGDGTGNGNMSGGSGSKKLSDIAYETLREIGGETHYKDLAARIMQQGFQIGGSDPGTYLIAYIGKDPRFVRVKRGTYGLAEWGLKAARRTGRKAAGRARKHGGRQASFGTKSAGGQANALR